MDMKANEARELSRPIIESVFKSELDRVYRLIKKIATKGEKQIYLTVDHKAIDLIESHLLYNGYSVKKSHGRTYNIIIYW